jgi:uncharacterized protein (TIGR00369 family)
MQREPSLMGSLQELEAAGWEQFGITGFAGEVGPFWRRETDGQLEVGLLVEDRHCNSHLGTVHGGLVMTFADIALGLGAAKRVAAPRFNGVTASLNMQFVAVAQAGEFLSCKPEVIHQGRQMLFMRGLIMSGTKTIASCEGIWKLLSKKLS